jgi:hypothetical protein
MGESKSEGVPDRQYILALEDQVDDLRSKLAAAKEVAGWVQAVLTALNVGNVMRESPLHKKLREVMIAYRETERRCN